MSGFPIYTVTEIMWWWDAASNSKYGYLPKLIRKNTSSYHEMCLREKYVDLSQTCYRRPTAKLKKKNINWRIKIFWGKRNTCNILKIHFSQFEFQKQESESIWVEIWLTFCSVYALAIEKKWKSMWIRTSFKNNLIELHQIP